VDQGFLSRCEPGQPAQSLQAGQPNQWEGSGFGKIQTGRHGRNLVGLHRDPLGEGPDLAFVRPRIDRVSD
jgi:hypothetical protein